MRKLVFLLIIPVMMMVSSCESLQPGEMVQEETALKSAGMKMNFRAHLTGDQEVPAVETNATGQAVFQLSKDGLILSYKLIVANIEDVRMAHIHLAPAGINGGVVAWLIPSGPPPILIEGKSNGILAEGVITADNLVGVLAGEPLEALVEAMKSGDTYVNVHTSEFPGGEIRGQISGN